MMKENKKNIFNKTHFAKNIKSLFNKESKNYYNKRRLNIELKSLICKEKSLNDRKIIDFNYGEMFHFFKVGMKKFDDEQKRRKNFYKTLYEENTRFNKEYQRNYSSNSQIKPKQTKKNIKSKTFQKFYDKHQITDKSKQINNLFNRDPLLVSNNDIKLFYMGKEPLEKEDEFKDEALDYVNRLESNLNQKSIITKMRNAIYNHEKKKKNKYSLNKQKEFPLIEDKYYNNSEKKVKDLKKNSLISKNIYRKYSMDLKRYNHKVKQIISNLNETNNIEFGRNHKLSFENNNTEKICHKKNNHNRNNFKNIFNDIDNDDYSKNIFFTISDKNIESKKEKNRSSNQIESLYNSLFQIKKNISKYEKKNEKEIRYLYTIFGHNSGKKIKQSFIENQKLIKLDKELVYSVNSFND